MPETQDSIAVALLYASGGGDAHLRNALKEHGAAIVYEALSAEIDRDALEGSGARVVVVNLGNDSDDYIDQVYDVLDTGQYEVVFNDAEVSQQLSGWDQARWARNLAAKITSQPARSEPPRPPEAPPVPGFTAPAVVESPEFSATPDGDDLPEPSSARFGEKAQTQRQPRSVASEPEPVVSAGKDESEARTEATRPGSANDTESDGLDLSDLGAFAVGLEELDSSRSDSPAADSSAAEIKSRTTAEDFSNTRLADELESLFAGQDAIPDAGERSSTEMADSGNVSQPGDLGAEVPEAFNLVDVQEHDERSGTAEATLSSTQDDAPQDLLQDDEQEPLDRSADVRNLKSLFSPEWDLEPIDTDAPVPPPPNASPDQFGINKVSATEYLDPEDEREGRKEVFDSAAGSELELMPMEEAIRPKQSDDELVEERTAASHAAGGTPIERVCVLGSSIGGPEAVRDFLAAIPQGFPVLFILAQHMGEEFLELMSTQLRRAIELTVRVPTHGERVAHGDVLIVPTTHRLKVDREGVVTFEKLWEKPENSPSIDEVLRDVADAFGNAAVAIVFSGMVNDAVEGGRYLKSKGGKVWVQDPKTCVVSTMVEGVQKAGVSEFAGSPAQLAQHLIAEFA